MAREVKEQIRELFSGLTDKLIRQSVYTPNQGSHPRPVECQTLKDIDPSVKPYIVTERNQT